VSQFLDTDTPAFRALVSEARENYTARAWLHDTSSLERDMLSSLAAAKHGTVALDFRDDPRLIRAVYAALLKPSVLLGVGTCPECSDELDVNSRCPRGCLDGLDCEPDGPRRYRTLAQKQARR
jgi:hypothetical protein